MPALVGLAQDRAGNTCEAQQRASSSLTCHGEGCEVRFAERIAPAMIKMDIGLRELAISRLRQSISNAYQQRLQRAMSTGTDVRFASEMQRSRCASVATREFTK